PGKARRSSRMGQERNDLVREKRNPGQTGGQEETQPGKKPMAWTRQQPSQSEAKHEPRRYLEDKGEQRSREMERVRSHKGKKRLRGAVLLLGRLRLLQAVVANQCFQLFQLRFLYRAAFQQINEQFRG